MSSKMNSIFFVEDHPVMQSGLVSYFEGTGRWRVAGKASTLNEAKKALSSDDIKVDIVLLDIQLDNDWGLDFIPWYRDLSVKDQDTIIAVYTNFYDYPHVNAAMAMGIQAYICKHRSENELEKALFTALAGNIYIDDKALAKVQAVKDIFCLLTKRETEILSLVKSGLSNKQIAAKLEISFRTVENILSCVYDKTGIRSRLELQNL